MKAYQFLISLFLLANTPAFGQTIPPLAPDRRIPERPAANKLLPDRRPAAPIKLVPSRNSMDPVSVAPGVAPGLAAGNQADEGRSAIRCRVPVTRIGQLQLGDSVAVLTDHSMEVMSALNSIDMPALLRGLVLRAESDDTAGSDSRKMTGLVLFYGGILITELRQSTVADLVFRNEGSIEGQLIGSDQRFLMIRKSDGSIEKIRYDSIRYIRSPRAFMFTLTGKPVPHARLSAAARTTVQEITFQPTATITGVSLSSVVPHKEDLLDEEDSPQLPKDGLGMHTRDEDEVPNPFNPTRRSFPNWP